MCRGVQAQRQTLLGFTVAITPRKSSTVDKHVAALTQGPRVECVHAVQVEAGQQSSGCFPASTSDYYWVRAHQPHSHLRQHKGPYGVKWDPPASTLFEHLVLTCLER